MRFIKFSIAILFLVLPACIAQAGDGKGAVIFVYHHVATDTPNSTSVTPAIFKKHLQTIKNSGYAVWPVRKIINHIRNDKTFDEHVIGITFDDAYASVYDNAYPLLKDYGYPFTIFVPGKHIGDTAGLYASWDQLKEMAVNSAHIGNHSYTHAHFVRHKDGESANEWLERLRDDIAKNQKLLNEKLDDEAVIDVFAYPYGEYTHAMTKLITDMGYTGLGQHSGALSPESDLSALPRYPMATGFAGTDSFTTKLKSRHLPATAVGDPSRIISPDDKNPPTLKLRIEDGAYDLARLNCFAGGQGRIDVQRNSENRFTITANDKLSPGRAKYNCTAPAKDEDGVYYWYSYLWLVKKGDNGWWAE